MRSTPGSKLLRKYLSASRSAPSASTLNPKRSPTCRSGSPARSSFTAIVKPGGAKDAWLTQLATSAADASPRRHVTTQSVPMTRPTACAMGVVNAGGAADSLPGIARPPFFASSRRFSSTCRASARPDSSHVMSIFVVGLNLHRMGLNADLKPPSMSLSLRRSTASPDQPNEPKTPHGLVLLPGVETTRPSAVATGVGMFPASVGLPMANPSTRSITSSISDADKISQLTISMPSPERCTPRAIACARLAVWPYALAYRIPTEHALRCSAAADVYLRYVSSSCVVYPKLGGPCRGANSATGRAVAVR
mmetsp:Transcript_9189/g.20822  ORF Transcript_9189/g.20822 Transcript_9189/m.20822 type:complete len:307 (+) Transcript_9189:1009-1929(+)